MGQISLQIPVLNQPDTTEDVKIQNGFTTIQNVINGNLDATNLSAPAAQSAGINQSGQVVKGSANIAASQSTNSLTYTTLATPDQVTGIVMPTNGLILVGYKALWSVGAVNGLAGLFLNSTQVTVGGQSAPAGVETLIAGSTNMGHLVSDPVKGLAGMANTGTASTDVSTGQLVAASTIGGGSGTSSPPAGGFAVIFAAAGTYTVSVQFRVSANTASVTASNRHLWVQALSFS